MKDWSGRIPASGADVEPQVLKRLNNLTKPVGSLGRLEQIVVALAKIQNTPDPVIRRKTIFTFAGDHGVTAEGVSLYPAAVTPQMVKNFLNGGAAINVLARQAGADVVVIDAGMNVTVDDPRLVTRRIGAGTENFLKQDAMSRDQAWRSIEAGADVFEREWSRARIDLAGVGDMGIGNTTSAAAIFCALLGADPDAIVGAGTGLDDAGRKRKADVVRRALAARRPAANDPVDVLAKVGGFEIAEMAGCFLAGAARRAAMLVDGYISSAAALIALRLAPEAEPYLIFSHASAENGHSRVTERLRVRPLLDLGLRLGEGTGAALAMPVIESALAVYNGMATFESAQVSRSN